MNGLARGTGKKNGRELMLKKKKKSQDVLIFLPGTTVDSASSHPPFSCTPVHVYVSFCIPNLGVVLEYVLEY